MASKSGKSVTPKSDKDDDKSKSAKVASSFSPVVDVPAPGNSQAAKSGQAAAQKSGGQSGQNIHGGKGDDTLVGTAGNDTIDGKQGNDTLYGVAGDDRMNGNQGDDILVGGAGNDYLDGGPHGFDTAVYSGNYADYLIVRTGGSGHDQGYKIFVTDLRAGSPDGTDELRRIDALQFADRTVLIDDKGNVAPVAGDDTVQGIEDTPLVIPVATLLANDLDLNGDALQIVSVQGAVNGTVSLDGAGNVVFVPGENFNGTATFTYTLSDGHGGTATGNVSVQVAPVNDAPVARDDSVDIPGSAPRVISAASLLANDNDVDGDTLSIVSVQGASHGSVSIDADGNVVFAPAAGYSGPASFTYTVSDGNGGFSTATVNLQIEGGNTNPVAGPDSVSGVEDTAVVIPLSTLLENDNDPDGDPLTVTSVGGAVHGVVALDGLGNVVFTPDPDFFGTATFEYTVSDGQGGSATATVQVLVANVNDAPVAQDDALEGVEDTPLVIAPAQLLDNDNDADGDDLTITSVGNAQGGTVAIVNGSVVFTPAQDFNGPARFDYTVSDGNGGTSSATVFVSVAAVNDLPVVKPDSVQATEDTPLEIPVATLLANDTDVDGDLLSIVSVQDALHGTVALDGAGNVVFTPTADYSGPASFTYTVSDGNGGFATASVAVDVVAVADAPEVSVPGVPAFGGGPLFQINAPDVQTTSAPVAHEPATARLAGGSVVVVWTAFDVSTGTNDILARHYGSNGAPLGGQSKVSIDALPGEGEPSGFNPAVVGLSDGGYVVAWNSLVFDESGLRSDILARRFDADGTPRGTEFRIDELDAVIDTDAHPVIAATSDGGFVVLWESVDASGAGVHGRSFGPDGTPLGSEFVVDVPTGTLTPMPAVAGLAGGDLLVVWQNHDAGSGTYSLVSQRFSAEGVPQGAATVIDTAGASVAPAVSALPDGGYVIAWQSGEGILAQRFDAAGAPSGALIEVAAPGSAAGDPSVTAQVGGGFVVTWTSENAALPPATGTVANIMGRRYDADGEPLADAFRIDSLVQNSHESQSSVAPLGGDDFFVAFTSQGAPGPSGDVFGRIYANGVQVSTLEDVPIPLDISAAVTDLDGSEVMSIVIDGVVAGFLSAGENLGGGRWLLAPEDLPGLTYTFDSNFNGTVGLSVTATTTELSNGSSATTQNALLLFVSVEPVNDAPVAIDGAFGTEKNVALSGTLAAIDIDGDVLSFALGTSAANGSVTVNPDGSFSYEPQTGFFGSDSFTFVVTDPSFVSSTAQVSITVTGQNDAPVALPSGIWTNVDTPAAGTLTASDTDTPASALTYTLAAGPAGGTLALAANGSFTYTPTAGFFGTDSFSFTVTDPQGAVSAAPASVSIHVAQVGGGSGGGAIQALTQDQPGDQFMAGAGGGRTMALLDTGEHLVAWSDAGGLYAQRIDPAGDPAGAAFRLDTGASVYQNVALAPIINDGGFAAVWEDALSGHMVGRKFDSAGNPVGGQFTISDGAGPIAGTALAAVADESGTVPRLLVTWEAAGAVHYARVALISSVSPPVIAGSVSGQVTLDAGPDAHSPTVTLLEDGSPLVVWQSNGDILARNMDFDAAPYVVNSTLAGVQGEPQVAAVAGGFVVTWTSDGQDGSGTGIYAQRFLYNDSNGTTTAIGGEFLVNTTTAGGQLQSSVTGLSDGGFLVSWTSADAGGNTDLFAQRYNADGTPSGSEFRLDSGDPGNQLFAEVLALDDGSFAAAWTSDESGGFEVYSRVIGASPNPDAPKNVTGTGGNDVIIGSLLADILVGGDGDDVLIGLEGNDTLTGGRGHDTMTGGAGADTFKWGSGETDSDVITDFSVAEGDTLDFCSLLVGYDPSPGGSDINNFLRLREADGNTTIDVDVYGTGANFVQLVTLSGVTGLDPLTDLIESHRIAVFCE